MHQVEQLRALYKQCEETALKDYFKFLSFQSISSEDAYRPQVLACVEWLAQYLREIGLEVQIWETTGHPTIFASYSKAGPTQPTLLIYNHYDVQPVDPVELWHSPPFQPTIKNGEVFARGAQDNKGQCFYTIFALKAMLENNKSLPINIKLCIEGEEECGSNGLSNILTSKQQELSADYLAIVDVGIPGPNIPAVTLGVRGLITMDVEVQGSNIDLHSGSHGGVVFNPIHALAEMLAALRESSGKIAVPGFYEDLVSVDKEECHLPQSFNIASYEQAFETKATGGEKALSPLERLWLRPTIEINGIVGGYTGTGFKTVIPAIAKAKLSCRLVPNQDPEKIGNLVANFLKARAPDGVTVRVNVHPGGGLAVRAKASSKVVKAFAQAYSEVFQSPCQYIFEGASIPIVTQLAAASKSEVVLIGLGLISDQIHAPNEHFGLDRLEKGFLIISRAIEILGNHFKKEKN